MRKSGNLQADNYSLILTGIYTRSFPTANKKPPGASSGQFLHRRKTVSPDSTDYPPRLHGETRLDSLRHRAQDALCADLIQLAGALKMPAKALETDNPLPAQASGFFISTCLPGGH